MRSIAVRAAVVSLVLSLSFAGCKREAKFARVDAALAPLIPPDAAGLACLRLDKLKDTPFYAKYVDGRKIPMLEKFAEETGLDLRKDVWELLLVMRSGGKPPVVLIRGKFGGKFGLEPEINKPGIQRMNYKGYNIIFAEGPAVMFMGPGAAVAGRIEDLKLVIDNRDNPKWSTPHRLLELVGTLPGSAQVWMATEDGGALLPGLPEDGEYSNYVRMLKSLGVATAHVDLRQGVDMSADGRYPNDQAARQMHDTLRALLGVARLRTPDNQPDMLRLIDGTRVALDGPVVKVTLNAPFELVEKLISLLPESRRPGS